MVYSMQFQNFSNVTWNRDVYGSSIDVALQNLNQSPGPILQANSGLEGLSASQSMFSFIATGDIDLYCCWFDPTSGQRFGIELVVPVQVFDMGYAPSWNIMQDSAAPGTAPNWISSGGDPSDMFSFSLNGFKITARPQADHSDLTVNVTVENT